jgi:protein-S-isoprenylcysteine O-methyltransferase Ste14
MLTRALVAFLILPGSVGFVVPAAVLWWTGRTRVDQPLGLVVLAVGIVGLFWCVKDFYVSGKGTLAPWAPPEKLVVVGLYRYSRNPMYVTVMLVLLGWAVSFGPPFLYIYMLLVVAAFHIRVVRGEEPWVARTRGSDWGHYASHRTVGVGVVRELGGAIIDFAGPGALATPTPRGVVVTSAKFSGPAKEYLQRNDWFLEGADFERLMAWLDDRDRLQMIEFVASRTERGDGETSA